MHMCAEARCYSPPAISEQGKSGEARDKRRAQARERESERRERGRRRPASAARTGPDGLGSGRAAGGSEEVNEAVLVEVAGVHEPPGVAAGHRRRRHHRHGGGGGGCGAGPRGGAVVVVDVVGPAVRGPGLLPARRQGGPAGWLRGRGRRDPRCSAVVVVDVVCPAVRRRRRLPARRELCRCAGGCSAGCGGEDRGLRCGCAAAG
jgi:hypothetical protein